MPGLEIDLSVYPNEETLLAALRRGDKDACTCLVKRFATMLYRPALQILDDADEADAVVQKAFIKACDKLDSYQEKSQLGTWLYRIAMNEALMERRRRAGKKASPIEAVDEEYLGGNLNSGDSPENDPVEAVLSSELNVFVADALEQLPETLRRVLFLRDIQGFSTAETAAQLDLSQSAVKVRLHRARRQVRTLLADYLEHK